MIDLHSHILPGLDDGSKSWDMTLEMCRLAIEDGITHIVATPHADDSYAYNRDRIRALVDELDRKVRARRIGPEFYQWLREMILASPHSRER